MTGDAGRHGDRAMGSVGYSRDVEANQYRRAVFQDLDLFFVTHSFELAHRFRIDGMDGIPAGRG